MNDLDAWIAAACTELGLQPGDVKVKAVLDVARDVAHQVIRPGAPISAYLMGVAVGRGADPSDVAARLSALALTWPNRAQEQGPDRGQGPDRAQKQDLDRAQNPGRAQDLGPAIEQAADRPEELAKGGLEATS